ncbi:MAG: hypothetical protein RJA63_2262 [Pseudomonadota bacterium]|jgi:hypothetical protein
MKTKHVKQIAAACLSIGMLGASIVLAASSPVCAPPSSLGNIFSTLPEGKVTMVNQQQCNPGFYGNATVNTASFNYPGKCDVYVNQAESDTKDPSGKLTASGQGVVGHTLPTFEESPETFKLYFTKTDKQLIEGGTTTDIKFINGTATVTTKSGRTLTIKSKANSVILPEGNYGEIEWQTMEGTGLLGIEFEGPVRVRYLHGRNCNPDKGVLGISFAQDKTDSSGNTQQNFINRFDSGDGCNWNVEGPGKTTLNILGKETLNSGTVFGFDNSQAAGCINYADCNATKNWANMDAQHPERLQINLYNGDFKASDRTFIAAGVYVPNGNALFTAASQFVIVGEVLAKNIEVTQNNAGVQFFGKSTSVAAPLNKFYSLTPPVSDRKISGGSLVYRATQRDYRADGKTKGSSGHLMAYVLNADSSHGETPLWDAADPAKMQNRASVIQTESATWASTDSDFTALGNEHACVIDPTKDKKKCFASNDPRDPDSLVGVPWRTEPIIVGESVLFATDDGILYSVNKTTGALQWGWIPGKILEMTQTANARVEMASKHPWGQIAAFRVPSDDGKSEQVYVTGTALGGQLHFAIEVGANGNTLKKLAWMDYKAGQYAPGSLVTNFDGTAGNSWGGDGGGMQGRPYGGAAPLPSLVEGAQKVAYLKGGKLFVRNVDGTGADPKDGKAFKPAQDGTLLGSGTTPVITPTSNLLYLDDDRIYFGAGDGKVYQSNLDGSLASGGVSGVNLGSDPVWHVNGAYGSSSVGSALMLTAQTERRLNVLKFAEDAWSLSWWTGVTAKGAGESSDGAVEKIGVGGAKMTAPASIMNGKVVLYYTKMDSDCGPTAYMFGPLSLDSGAAALEGVHYRTKLATQLTHLLGVGQATGGNYVVFDGKSGILGGSSGTNGATGDTGVITIDGEPSKKRLNWRELTNFF